MLFYHYTSVSLAESILSSSISRGHLFTADGRLIEGVVWLTTSDSSYGHGLLTGNEIFDADSIRHIERLEGRAPLQRSVADKTQIRITVDLDPAASPGLVRFCDYGDDHFSKNYAKDYGLSALIEIKKLSAKERKQASKNYPTKERTWWLSWSEIPSKKITKIDFWDGKKYVPYDFELHGRGEMIKSGFAIPSPSTISSLGVIVRSAHPLEKVKALLICPDLRAAPTVVIRGGNRSTSYEIATGKRSCVAEEGQIAGLEEWIRTNNQELTQCWDQAVESFKLIHGLSED